MLEVRHRAAHKGTAIGWLRARGPAGAPLIAIGDDITDEDMFVSLREGDVGILVAPEPRRTQAGPPALARRRPPLPALAHRRAPRSGDARARGARRRPHAEAPPGARLVVAWNRLPAAPSADRKREVGGLVSALLPVLHETNGIWLGWSGAERDPGLRLRVEDAEAFTRAQFDYPPMWRQRFYAGLCNRCPLAAAPRLPERLRYTDDEWQCYVEANRAYARLVTEAAGGDAQVWIQDFHLSSWRASCGAPATAAGSGSSSTCRSRRSTCSRRCRGPPRGHGGPARPRPRRVAGDALGRQLHGAAARGLLGAEGEARAKDRVRVFPIGIDPDRFAESAAQPRRRRQRARRGRRARGDARGPQAHPRGRSARLLEGIPERLEAFTRLLERYPEWRGKVSFVQVSVPTRSEVPEYAELRSRVEALVGRINGAYGEAGLGPCPLPVSVRTTQATLARLYSPRRGRPGDPLRDGMNLVAKEYVASQDPADPGVLVLSRFGRRRRATTLARLTNPFSSRRCGGRSRRRPAHAAGPARCAPRGAAGYRLERHTAPAWARTFPGHAEGMNDMSEEPPPPTAIRN